VRRKRARRPGLGIPRARQFSTLRSFTMWVLFVVAGDVSSSHTQVWEEPDRAVLDRDVAVVEPYMPRAWVPAPAPVFDGT
jgi:hypothetical protein